MVHVSVINWFYVMRQSFSCLILSLPSDLDAKRVKVQRSTADAKLNENEETLEHTTSDFISHKSIWELPNSLYLSGKCSRATGKGVLYSFNLLVLAGKYRIQTIWNFTVGLISSYAL